MDNECTMHNGCVQNATRRMRDAIHALDRSAVYYLDAGNPTNQMKLYNPHAHHVPSMDACVAENADQLAWRWATELDGPNGATTPGKGPHMIKAIFDMKDTWLNTLMNLNSMTHLAEYQTCGQFLTPDMLTVGMGAQTLAQYRAQYFLWAVLGAPLILSNDVRTMSSETLSLLANPEGEMTCRYSRGFGC